MKITADCAVHFRYNLAPLEQPLEAPGEDEPPLAICMVTNRSSPGWSRPSKDAVRGSVSRSPWHRNRRTACAMKIAWKGWRAKPSRG